MKNDRITGGAIAGIIGAVVQNIYGQIVKGIGLTDVAFVDFAKVIAFGKPVPGTISFISGLLAHLTLGMIFGTLFALIVMKTSSKYFLFKCIGYGAALWFITLGLGSIFKLPLFVGILPVPQLTTFVGAQAFGLATGYSLKIIQDKTSLV